MRIEAATLENRDAHRLERSQRLRVGLNRRLVLAMGVPDT
jgi:hypothetical protein